MTSESVCVARLKGSFGFVKVTVRDEVKVLLDAVLAQLVIEVGPADVEDFRGPDTIAGSVAKRFHDPDTLHLLRRSADCGTEVG
jgi:hypothetical protein